MARAERDSVAAASEAQGRVAQAASLTVRTSSAVGGPLEAEGERDGAWAGPVRDPPRGG